MDSLPLAEILALVSLILGLTAAVIFSGIALSRRRKKAAGDSRPPAAQGTNGPPSPTAMDDTPQPAERRQNTRQHSLFLVFAQPGHATDRRLIAWLKDNSATYDPLTRVFRISSGHPANPVTIANAFPPGDMPDLLRQHDDADEAVKGISLLVRPPLRRRHNEQVRFYVTLARDLQQRLGGDMLDDERRPATEATYRRIIGD